MSAGGGGGPLTILLGGLTLGPSGYSDLAFLKDNLAVLLAVTIQACSDPSGPSGPSWDPPLTPVLGMGTENCSVGGHVGLIRSGTAPG